MTNELDCSINSMKGGAKKGNVKILSSSFHEVKLCFARVGNNISILCNEQKSCPFLSFFFFFPSNGRELKDCRLWTEANEKELGI